MPARQSQALGVPGIGVAGDFADMNPRFFVDAGPGGLIAGDAGAYVGRAGWLSYEGVDPDNAPTLVNNFGVGVAPDGIIPRSGQNALITTYLADSSMLIQPGAGMIMMSSGGLLVNNSGSGFAQIGMKAYANLNDGQFTFAGTGAPTTVSLTTSTIAANTTVAAISMTGSISDNVLTITAVSTGTLYPGTILTGPSGVATGTQVVKQLSGTAGGVGTYALNIPEQSVASGTVVGTYGILTVGGGGPPVTGAILSGSGGGGVTAGTTVWGQLTATTWVVSPSQTVTSTTITAQTNIETKWYARSAGGLNELIKISDITQ